MKPFLSQIFKNRSTSPTNSSSSPTSSSSSPLSPSRPLSFSATSPHKGVYRSASVSGDKPLLNASGRSSFSRSNSPANSPALTYQQASITSLPDFSLDEVDSSTSSADNHVTVPLTPPVTPGPRWTTIDIKNCEDGDVQMLSHFWEKIEDVCGLDDQPIITPYLSSKRKAIDNFTRKFLEVATSGPYPYNCVLSLPCFLVSFEESLQIISGSTKTMSSKTTVTVSTDTSASRSRPIDGHADSSTAFDTVASAPANASTSDDLFRLQLLQSIEIIFRDPKNRQAWLYYSSTVPSFIGVGFLTLSLDIALMDFDHNIAVIETILTIVGHICDESLQKTTATSRRHNTRRPPATTTSPPSTTNEKALSLSSRLVSQNLPQVLAHISSNLVSVTTPAPFREKILNILLSFLVLNPASTSLQLHTSSFHELVKQILESDELPQKVIAMKMVTRYFSWVDFWRYNKMAEAQKILLGVFHHFSSAPSNDLLKLITKTTISFLDTNSNIIAEDSKVRTSNEA